MKRARRRRTVVAAALAAGVAGALWVRLGPVPEALLDPRSHESTRVFDRHGELLYEAPSPRGVRGRPMAFETLPEWVVAATLAAEDRRFFSHPGVDPLAVGRAAWRNLRAGRVVEGGSTLTQQTVKQVVGGPRSIPGKLREAVLALRLEARLDKREILALYLSLAPYGNQLVGVEAAARAYFGTTPAALTPAQAAFLAALPWRPSELDPRRHFARARERQLLVLERMRAAGSLDDAGLARARSERLRLVDPETPFTAPHFVLRALSEAPARSRLDTTLDAVLQREVEEIVAAHAERLGDRGARHAAVAVLDNATARWRAWVGSPDWRGPDGGAIDGVRVPRQPGSALKPFTYALAFDTGLTPASVLPDVPSHFETAQPGVSYAPRNYDGRFRGPLRARLALAGSENVPAVWALQRVGVPRLLALLRSAGLTTLDRNADHYGYALAMGAAEVRLDELTAAYAALARGGVWRAPRLLRSAVAEERGDRGAPAERRLVSARAAFHVADVLSDAEARGWVFGRGSVLDFPFPVAVKTGTSQASRDNWTLGFTRDVTVGVWVGNFDRREMRGSAGAETAAPLFRDVLFAAQRHLAGRLPDPAEPLVRVPAGLGETRVCALSGRVATALCPRVAVERLAHSGPDCDWHVAGPDRARAVARVVWPARYHAWAAERGLLDPDAAPASGGEGPALWIANPPAGAVYFYDPTLRAAFQTLPLRAERRGAPAPLEWSVDGRPVGRARSDAALDWPLRRGSHRIEVRDPTGATAVTRIAVR